MAEFSQNPAEKVESNGILGRVRLIMADRRRLNGRPLPDMLVNG